MDPYVFCLTLGGAGLGIMGLSGVAAARGARGASRHGPRSHRLTGRARGGHRPQGQPRSHGHQLPRARLAARAFWALTSPRTAFSLLLGLGATGTLMRESLGGGLLLFGIAMIGGVALERLLVTPLSNFFERFGSAPALTFETAIADEASAASSFDARGQGLVAMELDGQIVQCLGTLTTEDRAAGVHVRAGDRLRIEDVDPVRNRCTVSRCR